MIPSYGDPEPQPVANEPAVKEEKEKSDPQPFNLLDSLNS